MSEKKVCRHCGREITPNDGRYPRRGPWLDSVDWSVCDWTYRNHEPKDQGLTDEEKELVRISHLRRMVIVVAEKELGDEQAVEFALREYERELAHFIVKKVREDEDKDIREIFPPEPSGTPG